MISNPSVLELALAAIKAHCSKDNTSTSLTLQAVNAITNAIKLERSLLSVPDHPALNCADNINNALIELEQISSQAESVAIDVGQSIRSGSNVLTCDDQLETIICKLETAASSIRSILPVK